ncbi:MAG: hypothetical protein IH859_05770, partial [Chloroflexi bacterium]|nr:hypothetical protein [Chloroflexota bacterium]
GDTLDSQLNTLERVELIKEASRLPELEYIFRHELTRDAAYATILRRQRRKFHLQVGETIEKLFPDNLEEEAHRLGHHFAQAKDNERARKYYTLAAKAAARLYANVEAADHYAQAIKFAHLVEVDNPQLIDLYLRRGRALELTGGFEEALRHYQELENLGIETKQPDLELAALTPQATIASIPSGQYDGELSRATTERALQLARKLKDPKAEAKALWNKMLVAYFIDSDSAKTIEYSLKAQPIAREHKLTEELAFIMHDSVRPYASLGKFDESEKAQAESEKLWRQLNNMSMLADNLAMSAAHLGYQGKVVKAIASGEEALQINRSIDNLWGQAYSLNVLGVIFQELGEISKTIQNFRDSIPIAEQADFSAGDLMGIYLSRALADIGDYESAHQYLDQSKMMTGDYGELFGRYILAVKAYVQMRQGKAAEAKATLETALQDYKELNLESINTAVVLPIRAEVALVNEDYQTVISLADESLNSPDLNSIRFIHPYMLLFKAQAHSALEEEDEAQAALEQARQLAEEFNSRIILWRIYAELSRQAAGRGDDSEAAAMKENAADVIDFIADHTGTDELKASFLATEGVKQILSN